MPIKKASIKHARQTIKRTAANRQLKNELQAELKKARKLIVGGKKDEAKTQILKVAKLLDKGARKNIISKNTAARKKSRLARALNKK
ncbi:30S ribosomal protein S20 [Candidatus Parcubacteria bacterium]|jgi:small subunit ribosomal protein S20|nr:MAG: 30S ribosomal protein S20 [Candidatus Parcubacteria bacterium]